MADQWFSCKACSTSDPTQDTVKVDPSLISRQNSDKENLRPVEQPAEEQPLPTFTIGQIVLVFRSSGAWSQGAVAEINQAGGINQAELTVVLEEGGQKEVPSDMIHSHVKPLTAARQKQEEDKVRRLREQKFAAEQERLRQKEAKSVVDIKARRQALEEARVAELAAAADAAEEAAAASAAEEQRLRQAAEKQREQDREAAEAKHAAAAALAAAQNGVSKWCNQNGFKSATQPKKGLRGGTKFPLHTAVKYSNQDIVEMLLKCGADRSVLDSRKQTPGELAAKMNRNGSHDRILAIFAQ